MAFLKQLRSSIEENARTAEVKRWRTYKHYPEQVEKAKAALAEHGEAVEVTAYEIPVEGLGTRLKKQTWLVEQADWVASEALPHRLELDAQGFDRAVTVIWLFDGKVYLALDPDLAPTDVKALLNQEKNKRRLALEKAHALQTMTERLDKPRMRERLPQEVRIEVWQRDSGRCVECGSQENLEFDHIIPFAMGGSSTARNLQLLCGDCNRRKGMTLG